MENSSALGFCALVLAFCVLPFCYGGVVTVHPVAPSCTSVNCSAVDADQNVTLDDALQSITSDTYLQLLPGCHCIRQFNFVRDVSNISLVGMGDRASVNITCMDGLGLPFFNVSELTIESITVEACGLSGNNLLEFRHAVDNISYLFFHIHEDYQIALVCGSCYNFHMSHVTVTGTVGLGFLGINVLGDSILTDVEFSLNIPQFCYSLPVLPSNLSAVVEHVGGGAMFLYHDYREEKNLTHATLNIIDSTFLMNSYCGLETIIEIFYRISETAQRSGHVLGAGGGLSVVMAQLQYSANVTAESSTFRNNTARFGGGAHVSFFAGVSNSHIVFSNCLFDKNGLEGDIIEEVAYSTTGAGLAFLKDLPSPLVSPDVLLIKLLPDTLVIRNTNFTANRAFSASAIIIDSLYSPIVAAISDLVLIDSCRIEDNIGVVGAAMYISETKQSGYQEGLLVQMKDTNVTGNKLYTSKNASTLQSASQSSSVIDVLAVNFTVAGNSTFNNNRGTVIRVTSGILYLDGNISFCNNSGIFGGALRIFTSSFMVIRRDTQLLFLNNSAAIEGGAIYSDYIGSLPTFAYYDCFLYFDALDLLCFGGVDCPNISQLGVSINFTDNSAPLGSVIFGSTLETCPWGIELKQNYHTNISLFELLYEMEDVFHFSSPPDNIGVVTTPTSKILVDDYMYSVTPGEWFYIHVKTIDHFGRRIPTVITSQPTTHYSISAISSQLGSSGFSLTQSDHNFTRTPVAVYGESGQENISITLFAVDSYTQTQFIVDLSKCAIGFYFDNTTSSCTCDYNLAYTGIECDNQTQEFTVPDDLWVGPAPDGDLIVDSCILDYCRPGRRTIKPPYFDYQCREDYQRSGILCGKCKDGYSAVFGSNRCRKCSNYYLLLILSAVVGGILVILAISRLRITISDGYLNGILLYCNCLGLYLPFFAADSSGYLVFAPVAFLNLDIGFEACLFDGMDALTRSGLKLLFPLYLFILMGAITLLAKRSSRFSLRFTRFSAAKLFATLMLMSFTSLLETCAEILGFIQIQTLHGDTLTQWRIDPNQGYFKGAHIPLALFAIALLVFWIIPAPLLLIFPAFAFKLRFVQKLKPIYDAFWAPFKPRFRFWVGLRLLLRVFPFSFAFFLSHPQNTFLLGIFLVVLIYVQLLVWPFEGFTQNAFDLFFLGNLLMLVLSNLYFNGRHRKAYGDSEDQDDQFIAFAVIVLVAYIGFIVIFAWHLVLRYPCLKRYWQKLQQKLLQKLHIRSGHSLSVNQPALQFTASGTYGSIPSSADSTREAPKGPDDENSTEVTPVQVVFSELREPLLDDEGTLELFRVDD